MLGPIVIAVAGLAALTLLNRPPLVEIPGSGLHGQPAPDFELQRLDGGTLRLSELRGRPVIVNFWASWCIPCREEFPILRDARLRHAADGLEIVGVVHRDSLDSARRFAADHNATWPMVDDREEQAWNAYGAQLLPFTLFVDREGIVRAVSFGPPPPTVMEQYLERIL
ncbi:MAG TPA: TlpA disulfide reductase family protein [Candidatus Limnocylindrales bacterium]|nr:TlpA disulfide reductase family protein [Candidatus Limnocylindrales bacterium]